jgi:amino acid transporter
MPPNKPWQDTYGVGLAIALWTYAGYQQLSTVIEEVENPTRNFPIGLAIVIPLSIAVYIVTLTAGLSALGNWQAWETGYLVTAGRLIGGNPLGTGIFLSSVITSFVILDSTLLSVSRVPLTMAEDGYLHPALGKVSARFGTPVRSILFSTAFCAAHRGLYMDADGDLGTNHALVLAVATQTSRYSQKFPGSRWQIGGAHDGNRTDFAVCVGDDL